MSKNVWDLTLDLKFRFSAQIPQFRRKDSAVLNMHLFEAKERKDISNFTKATLRIQLPSQEIKEVEATRQGTGMDTYVQYQFTNDIMTEIGVYSLILTVEKDGGRISTQKFSVYFYDNESNADFEFINMMQNLQLQINYLDSIRDNLVLKDLIGKANGLIPLDSNGKIPMEYMPLFLNDHINTNIYLKMVHGLMVDANLNLIYEGKGGNLEYVGHKEGSATLSLLTSVKQGVVTLTYYGVGTVTEQRWAVGNKTIDEMKVQGTLFTGLEFKVSTTGTHTIYYKDANGKEYLHKFNVDLIMLPMGDYNVYVRNGDLVIEGSPRYSFLKLARGIRDLTYMRRTSNGTVITIPHKITESAQYTLYIIDEFQREYLRLFYVSADDLEKPDDIRPLQIQIVTQGYSPSKSFAVGKVKARFYVTDADGNNASDKIDYVVRPNSTVISGQTSDDGIDLLKNGTYTWTAYNKAGIGSTATLKVENIGIEKNLKDLPIGSKFYIYQNEAVLLKKESGKNLIAVNFGWNYPFSNQYVTETKKNLYPNSSVKTVVYYVNYDDVENQLANNVKGNVNYQYGQLTDSNRQLTPVGSPIYDQQERFVLDAFTLQDAVKNGYLTVTRDELTSTPINGTDDKIVTYDMLTELFSPTSVGESKAVSWIGMWQNDQTKVWQKGW